MNPETIAKHEEYRNNLFHFLVLLQISLAGAIFVFSIFVSHKIAGPMFKLTRYLQEIRNGAQITHLSFREGDQFPEVAEEINETLEYLTQKNEEEMEYLSEISEYLSNLALVIPDDKKPVLEEIRRKISQFQGIEQ